jgi:hypothetical protein
MKLFLSSVHGEALDVNIDTHLAVNTPIAQVLLLNIIHQSKKAGLLKEMSAL